MKIIHLNTYDRGGTGRAVIRLNEALTKIGKESSIMVQVKTSDQPNIISPTNKLQKGFNIVRPILDQLPILLQGGKSGNRYNMQWLPNYWAIDVLKKNAPDIINLHWIEEGFIDIKALTKINTPLVWTLHDVWPFTGGCNVNLDCTMYQTGCHNCPILPVKSLFDVANWVTKQKIKYWGHSDITFVAPSSWIAEAAKSSLLAKDSRVEIIANGLDTDVYKPINKNDSRNILNLPQDKILVLFGALNPGKEPWKGYDYLSQVLDELKNNQMSKNIELVLFGDKSNKLIETDFVVHNVGRISDDVALTLLYSSADIVLMPSLQESFGQVASEAFACGTPVVAFNTTGLKDIIDHKENGYLAEFKNPADLAMGILWALEKKDRCRELGQNARNKAEKNFSGIAQAKKYNKLYEELIEQRKHI